MSVQSRLVSSLLSASLWLLAGTAAATPPTTAAVTPDTTHLATFHSQHELDTLLADWKRRAGEAQRRDRNLEDAVAVTFIEPPPAPAPASASAAPAKAANESITNNQTQGVDEGDIVKRHGDFLIILRRGRLFTVKIGGDTLRPVSHVDAYAPDANPDGTWYDELLVSGDTVVVIGYSYQRSATEVGLFKLADDGRLRYRDTYYLRSNDYYDSRNYASRLIGSTLVFYTPLRYSRWNENPLLYPGWARRSAGTAPVSFQRLLPAEAIYRADERLNPLSDAIALHTVTRCELAGATPHCTSTGVLGPAGRTFYVSRSAVYVWVAAAAKRRPGYVLRMPLDGGPVSALQVHGMPIDQLSFLEDDDGQLNVVVQSQGLGQGMWRSEWGEGQLALLRVPLAAFGTLRATAPHAAYRFLPPVSRGNRQNRFVGNWLLYGATPYPWSHSERDSADTGTAFAVRYALPDEPIRALPLGHGVQRIEAMGSDAVLVGPVNQDLVFSTVALTDLHASLRSHFVVGDSQQSESRTHGFSYRRDGLHQGVVGLPILRVNAGPIRPFEGAPREIASVLYLQNDALNLRKFGELVADTQQVRDDACKASCVDWYGNARPIFIGQRVFALLGYELVEGASAERGIVERRRVNFAPGMPHLRTH